MNAFLKKYEFLHLSELMTSNGVEDEQFMALNDARILEILGDQPQVTVLNFVSKFNFEKGLTMNSNEGKGTPVEPMDVTEIVDYENLTQNQNGPSAASQIIIIEEASEMEQDTYSYKENELFHLLNDTLEGRIVLGKYRQVSRELDYCKLKNIVILNALKEDARNYKMRPGDFIHLRDQIVELFPTEDPELFYVPYYKNEEGQCIGARGLLYNHYKHLRKELRLAGIFNSDHENDNTFEDDFSFGASDQHPTVSPAVLGVLCDSNRAPYSPADVIREWSNSYTERVKVLIASIKKKEDPLKKYFSSFPCLAPPLGINLLESDFGRIVKDLQKQQKRDDANDLVPECSTLFSSTWEGLSTKIIAHFRKSKIKEVKEFFKVHEKLIDDGTHNAVLALLLLPICVSINKSFKDSDSKTVYISKVEISKSFILHVQEYENVEREKEDFENFLKKHNQPVLPYVIFCGKIERIYQTYVILNNDKNDFEDPVKAVEACLKCLTALRKWPHLCDYVWGFIQKFVLKIDSNKNYAAITKLIVQLRKK